MKTDFFGQQAGLSVSGQLEGEMAAMAFGKIYTFGPSFRAEKSNTQRHVAEFWHVEPEVAFAELPDVLEIAEDMMKYVIKAAMERCPTELEFFNKFMERSPRLHEGHRDPRKGRRRLQVPGLLGHGPPDRA